MCGTNGAGAIYPSGVSDLTSRL